VANKVCTETELGVGGEVVKVPGTYDFLFSP